MTEIVVRADMGLLPCSGTGNKVLSIGLIRCKLGGGFIGDSRNEKRRRGDIPRRIKKATPCDILSLSC